MQKKSRSTFLRFGGAIAAVFLAITARLALDPLLGDLFPFATLFLAVLVVAGYAGRGPALLAIVLGALASARFLLPPRDRLWVEGFEDRVGLILYLVISTGITILGGAFRKSRQRVLVQAEEALRQREQLQITLSSIGDAVLVTDAEGRVLSLNPVAEAITGWSSADASGAPIDTVFVSSTNRPAKPP